MTVPITDFCTIIDICCSIRKNVYDRYKLFHPDGLIDSPTCKSRCDSVGLEFRYQLVAVIWSVRCFSVSDVCVFYAQELVTSFDLCSCSCV